MRIRFGELSIVSHGACATVDRSPDLSAGRLALFWLVNVKKVASRRSRRHSSENLEEIENFCQRTHRKVINWSEKEIIGWQEEGESYSRRTDWKIRNLSNSVWRIALYVRYIARRFELAFRDMLWSLPLYIYYFYSMSIFLSIKSYFNSQTFLIYSFLVFITLQTFQL